MSWYKTGTISILAGSRVVTGGGTRWADPKHGVNAGQMLLVPGAGNVVLYEIERIDNANQIILATDFSGESISGSAYAIVTTYTNSVPDFARRLAGQLAYYQNQLDGWQSILTERGEVTLIAPDGNEVTIRTLKSITEDVDASVKWFDDNKEIILSAADSAITSVEASNASVSAANNASLSAENAIENAAMAKGSHNAVIALAEQVETSTGNAAFYASAASESAEAAANSAQQAANSAASIDVSAFEQKLDAVNSELTAIDARTKPSTSERAGVVKVSSAIDSDDSTVAASSAAVKSIADRLPQMVILYPNGTAETPYTITRLTRLEVDSPFPGRQIMCLPEVLANNIWGCPGWIYQEPNGYGVGAYPINNGEKIIIQTGSSTSGSSVHSGGPHARAGSASDKIRVKVWTID